MNSGNGPEDTPVTYPFYDEDAQELVLSTGRREYCFSGTIGIGADHDYTNVQYGHDGGIRTGDWTPQERQELAAYMVALWTAWADHVPTTGLS